MKIKFPVLIVNFKTYETATGSNAVKLARIIEHVAKKTGINIMISVQAADIYRVSRTVKIPVLAQHIDPVDYGKNTGSILAEDIKENGGTGTILNHAEKRINIHDLKLSIQRAKSVGLLTVVCASDEKMAGSIAMFNPDIISIEPPELIGTGRAVSELKPDVITNTIRAVHKLKKIPVLCGAGIRTPYDIKKAMELGTKGILISSGVTLSKNPEKYLLNLVKGFGQK
jgi:triosephosphate isomerase